MVDVSQLKLGKKLGVVQDRRTLLAAQFVDVDAVKLAPIDYTAKAITQFPVFANDRLGDCGLASQGHRIVAQERSSHQSEIQLTDGQVVEAYSAISGYDPQTGANDNGVYLLDVCNYMRKTGMGLERDGTRHTIGAFAKVPLSEHRHVRAASKLFGGLYIGAGLPVSAQQQVGSVWDVVSGPDARWGSWGGHAMYVQGWTPRGPVVVTWGQRQPMTWAWWDKYVDECYALISEDFLRRGGTTPQGYDQAALLALLARL